MFAGIVETTASIVAAEAGGPLVKIAVQRPSTFDDIKIGDSICTDGVCLTVETFNDKQMTFALGPETLKVTGWTTQSVVKRAVNLERSLRLQDRIHGHLVTGHVDMRGELSEVRRDGETQFMEIRFAESFKPFIWAKGSVAVNGVSLTVNRCEDGRFTVGLIPETLKRTNLGTLKTGDSVNLEIDNMARGLVNWAKLQRESGK